MNRIFSFLILLPFLGLSNIHAQKKTATYIKDPHADPPAHPIAINHLDATLSFIPHEWKVLGEATLTIIPNRYHTDSIVLVTPGFDVEWVKLDNEEVKFRQTNRSLIVYPSEDLKRGKVYHLSMKYQSTPVATGIYFVGWKPDEVNKRKQIWAHRPFGWLPYMDGRITMDIKITFDSAFSVFTNGERVSVVENPDGTNTWHYQLAQNHPFFSTALGISDYDFKLVETSRGVPIELLYYRGMEKKVEPTYQFTQEMFDFFGGEIGAPYPYTIYREIPVIDYMYGGMECTTATIFGDYMLIDPRAYWQRNYINVNSHELAHQWFGDCIGHLAHKDVWLTESFGTYYAKVFERSVFGDDYYQNMVRDEQQAALDASKRNSYPIGSSQGGRARIYDKGSVVLGMLRDVLGEREFKDVIRTYFRKFKFGSAETQDFIRTVYDVTGQSYNWFFDQWILRPGEPQYKINYRVLDDTTGLRNTLVSIEQIHKTSDLTGLFRMPIWFQVWYTDGSCDSIQSWIEEKVHEVVIPNQNRKTIHYVLFDPGNHIMKEMTFKKSYEELAAQAMNARYMIDRFDALVSLREIPVELKRDLLIRCFDQETFHLTKSEILQQLSGDRSPQSIELFRSAIHDPDATVRKSLLSYLNPFPSAIQEDAEALLSDSSYLNVELALDRLYHDFPDDASRYLEITKDERGWRGYNIRMKWLQLSIEDWKLDLLPELIAYTAPNQEFEIRMNAFSTLKSLGYLDETIAKNAFEASNHWNRKLASNAQDFLDYFSQQDEYRELIHEIIVATP